MPVYDEAAYENALIDLFTNTLGYTHVYGPDIERDWHSPLYDSVLEDSIRGLIQRRLLLQLMRLFLSSDILKTMNLKRKTLFLWNTCRMGLK